MRQRRRLDQPRAHLPACLGRTRKTAEPFISSLRHRGKKYNKRKGKTSGPWLDLRTAWTSTERPTIAAKKTPHRRLGSRHDYRREVTKGIIMSHVDRKSKLHQSSPSSLTRAQPPSCRACGAASFCRSPIKHRNDHLRQRKRVRLPRSKLPPSIGCSNPTLRSLITRGNAASTNTQTASSGSTSQKAQTSLRCRTPTSKGSRTNSTPAPARLLGYQTPKRGFPRWPLERRLLHFTVEWA